MTEKQIIKLKRDLQKFVKDASDEQFADFNYYLRSVSGYNDRFVTMIENRRRANKKQFKIGEVVHYQGSDQRVDINDEWVILKINRTRAHCKNMKTNRVWSMQLSNLVVWSTLDVFEKLK